MHTVGGAPHETATAGKSRNHQHTASNSSGTTPMAATGTAPSLSLKGKASKTLYSNGKLPPKPGNYRDANTVDEASEDSRHHNPDHQGATRAGSIYDD